ncbi:iron ABC transporter permease [Pelagibius sp.]|uniref:ABC transporter permease n=1 Tax=Pelagibius sp. TaxID=1931238 RepID=UPI0026371CDE|nr:iron ABC transporter permease [Pelagibius sp.]
MISRTVGLWLAVGWLGYLVLPWYAIEYGFWAFDWITEGYPLDGESAPAILQVFTGGKPWLAPLGLALLAPLFVLRRPKNDPLFGIVLLIAGGGGLAYLLFQAFAIGLRGWEFSLLETLFGPLDTRQFGLGYGAVLVSCALLFFLTQGIAARGAIKGDVFVVGSIGLIIALVAAFVFFPVLNILTSALHDKDGAFSAGAFAARFVDQKIWGLKCLTGPYSCGVAWNSLLLAMLTGLSTTILGLAFALIATRTGFRFKRSLRVLTVLPIITPPFVIGLAVILLLGRSGAVTQFLDFAFGIPATRWIYGLPGIWFAQTLAFAPIAFLVMIGVVEGVSPSMEEAALTLRADAWKTFTTVSLPLMRPGLANAFLLGFIESLADFGNPLVLGGRFGVLSTEIFFSIVGSQYDQGRAAVLAMVLLTFTLGAFYAQRRWVGRKSYATVTGKGDSGLYAPLPKLVTGAAYGLALPWAALTFVIYVMIMVGGFVETWGRDHSLTLRHYIEAFSITTSEHGLIWSGAAWNSFWTTITIATIAAPLTATIGLLTAYVLVRQRFAGRDAFEFGTMLSFAIPGTVIGISYILAFNVPPLELTGTGVILVICFVFRNMPVGVRAGIAAMSQLDKSLDEASLTLGANTFATVRRVILPLLRPAIVAALVFSFVRAMTAISAVIFLVSANYDMATSYIIGRVENGDYGLAIAYSSTLILVMLLAITLVQLAVGERRIRRRGTAAAGSVVGQRVAR